MDAKWRQLCPGARENRPKLEKPRTRESRRDFLSFDRIITVVVGKGQERGQVAAAVLGDDAETGEGAPLAGDVEGRVTAVVHQLRVGAGLQELVDQLRLICDDCEVKCSLGKKKEEKHLVSTFTETPSPSRVTLGRVGTCLWWFCTLRKG